MSRRTRVGTALLLAGMQISPPALPGDLAPTSRVTDPRIGRRIYLEGIQSSGAPLRATVQGDVTLLGTQVACVSCHQRSGMGSSEGSRLAPPVTGRALYAPGRTHEGPRPAYTEESVVRAITSGVAATGRQLDPLMPRYEISPEDARALVAYLGQLSAQNSPGVTDLEIRFATVVSEDLDPAAARSMLDVLEGYIRGRNVQTRQQRRRAQAGREHNFDRPMYASYRDWRLSVWTLRGPESTWRRQLDSFLERESVFGLLSGMVAGDWRVIHEFCEEQELPCILPNTDRPPVDVPGYHTRYFSGGLDLEAKTIAAHVRSRATSVRVAQLFRDDPDSLAAADSLRRAFADKTLPALIDVPLVGTGEDLAERVGAAQADALVLWIRHAELTRAADIVRGVERVGTIYLSSTLLGAPLAEREYAGLAGALLVHPFAPTSELPRRLGRLKSWLASSHVPSGDPRIQDQTFFACMMTGEALMQVRLDFLREYFLERLDHGGSGGAFSAFYPRLSFGPGQAFLSKGCYVLPLDAAGAGPPAWIVP